MARQETVLSVFVASPSDVEEERNQLEEVIRELNVSWSRELCIRLELIRWETHTYPGFGKDPQEVINNQIPDDFDVFIGILWYRYGTPTSRAESGTIEEFLRAKNRFDKSPDSLQLMIYFKDTPIPLAPSKIDYKQLEKVKNFRDSLGPEGGYYFTFNSTSDFVKLVRIHLTRYVQKISSGINSSDPGDNRNLVCIENSSLSIRDDNDEEEFGLFELMEIIEDEFSILEEITQRITDATVEIGDKMNERTAETSELSLNGNQPDIKGAKRIITKVAADMDQYVARIDSELPLFSEHLNHGIDALTRASLISIDFIDDGDLTQVEENLVAIRNFCETMNLVEHQIIEFQSTVAALPRMTSNLNKSKRSVVNVLQRLIDELKSGYQLASEAEKALKETIEKSNH